MISSINLPSISFLQFILDDMMKKKTKWELKWPKNYFKRSTLLKIYEYFKLNRFLPFCLCGTKFFCCIGAHGKHGLFDLVD